MKNIRDFVADKMSLPKDVVLDLPRVSLCGDKEIFIENHKGILEYSAETIRIKMKNGTMNIYGKDLQIIVMEPDRMVINGEFIRAEYEKFGRKIKNVQKNL